MSDDYTEQDIRDLRADLQREERDLDRLMDAMPLPGREQHWAAEKRRRQVRVKAMRNEYERAVRDYIQKVGWEEIALGAGLEMLAE